MVEGSIDTKERVSCEDAFANTLEEPKYASNSTWLSVCEQKIVVDRDGLSHKAWERMVGYQPADRPYQIDVLYASVITRQIVVDRPQVLGLGP